MNLIFPGIIFLSVSTQSTVIMGGGDKKLTLRDIFGIQAVYIQSDLNDERHRHGYAKQPIKLSAEQENNICEMGRRSAESIMQELAAKRTEASLHKKSNSLFSWTTFK